MSDSKLDFIPVAAADVSGNEEKYVVEAVRSTWISSTGAFVDRFEAEFAEACGTRTSIAVCNGTVALHLALLALDVRRGDEVLVPSLTYVATANAVRYLGAEPVFVDVDPETWCIDPDKLEAAITRRTRGIIPVHLYGHPADMDAINQVAAVHGLWVLGDAAEAHFAKYRGRTVGSLAPMATFSFYGNKMITCGEGGAIALDDPQMEVRLRTLRGQGVDPKRRYYFPVTGYNFRLTNVACALLCAQLERRDAIVAARRQVYRRYKEGLAGVHGISMQPVADWAEPAPWLFTVRVDQAEFGMSRDALGLALKDAAVDSRPAFVPLHSLPMFREESKARGEDLPHTDAISSSAINLPTFNQMTEGQVERVCEAVRKAAR